MLPSDTDAAIDTANQAHVAFAGECAQARGSLWLFLPGTGGIVSGGDHPFVRLVARHCFHSIGLNYPNVTAVINDCVSEPREPDCYAAWRLEKNDGIDRSAKIRISPANSIENRLLKLLQYLAAKYPEEDWGRYLDGASIRWQDVVVSGFSQGGGQAAMLAKTHLVARVLMFGSVTDVVGSLNGSAAGWEFAAGATPPERYFGFVNQGDQFWPGIRKGWSALGLDQFGDTVNVDLSSPPFAGSHQLETALSCPPPGGENCAHFTVLHLALEEKLTPVWEYMLGVP